MVLYVATMPGADTSGEVDFGFRRVAATEKAGEVRRVFDAVSPRYDLMNDLMSGGIHRLWKAQRIAGSIRGPGRASSMSQAAPATSRCASSNAPAAAAGHRLRHNETMLRTGRDRAIDAARSKASNGSPAMPSSCRWRHDRRCCTIAFGLRNVTKIGRALAEMRRVLRPGGRFVCLEFSRVVLPLLARAYDLYSFAVLPRLGHT